MFRSVREFFVDNAAAIAAEVYAVWWWCRCKSAANVARLAIVLGMYCKWRGERAWVALIFIRLTCAVARRLLPAPLRIME